MKGFDKLREKISDWKGANEIKMVTSYAQKDYVLARHYKSMNIAANKMREFIDDIEIEYSKNLDISANYGWIPCDLKMPLEKEDIFRFTDPLTDVDIERKYMGSDLVEVTVIGTDTDERFVSTDCTKNGEWRIYCDEFEVIAWKPLPKPYREENEDE